MAEIVWGINRNFHSGIDRGVIYPKGKPAVAWNGLISVDESGDQARSTYYVDGRKYLSVVTPREYSAKIEAYTFPDELAELCGIVEAADGLFLDSQVPDQFGMSYRTMINGGESYRIHIIFGVTAMMDDVSFSTHDDETSPTTFGFDIEALPMSIDGYRPTAHAMIDSTNISPQSLYEIEKQLYGYEDTEPQLPSLQSLYDMLSFGELLVIRDPGDGTFTIEGSYKYILERPDGTFEVTNLKDEQVVFDPGGQVGYYDLTVTP